MTHSTIEMDSCERMSACFHDLNKQELDFINSKKTEVSYLPGETLFKQGAFAPHVLLVLEGLVKVYLQTGDKQINLFLVKGGDFLAFSSVFGEPVHIYSAVAVTNVQLCMMDKESMHQVLLGNADFAFRISSRNCRNESQYLSIIHNLTYRQMRGKLASALLYLSSDEFADLQVFPYLTRQDIAGFASIATESAIKFLKEFEKEAIIALEGKDIKILNRKKLEEIEKYG